MEKEMSLGAAAATWLSVAVTMNLGAKALGRLKIQWLSLRHASADPDGKVDHLFIHPVKSLKAVAVDSATIDVKGFENDRRYMIVSPLPRPAWGQFLEGESTHRFLSQRQCPSLATVAATLKDHKLVMSWKGKTVQINKDPPTEQQRIYKAGIWGDQVQVVDMGDEAANFLQTIVDAEPECRAGDEGDSVVMGAYQNVRLVAHVEADRQCPGEYTPLAHKSFFTSSTPPVALTDGFPILVACQSSLDRLNEKLKEAGKDPIPMSRFRPNIVISGTKAFDEDNWKTIQIGSSLILSIVKACPRCKQSCTDQETGQVTAEPVQVMKTFRALGDNAEDVFFAQNAVALGAGGTVAVNAPVKILERGNPVYE
jgi:uncharacterized protein